MENEMAVPSEGFGLTLGRDPKSVLADAHRAAKALKDLISSKPKDEKVMMNGKQYLEFEDWQTLGAFYGAKAKAVSTEYVEIGTARGFKAKAVVVDANGNEISSAEAMCLNDEDKWSTRAKYEWVNGKKEKVGDVAVPTFQLMSMAQTRACAKALRNVFSWVVVLAGYAPTPAEDMTGDETPSGGSTKEPIKPAERKESNPTPGLISDAQRKRFYAIWKGAGKTQDEVKAKLREVTGDENSALIPREKYEELCAWAESKA